MLRPLLLKDREIFKRFLSLNKHQLSSYQFSNIFIWQALYKVKWEVIGDSLCVFFKDNLGIFMYLEPLGEKVNSSVVKKCFQIMDRFNKNSSISRIENVEEENVDFYKGMGFRVKEKYPEYVYLRKELIELKGERFKAKRRDINYFLKNYKFRVLPFSLKYKDSCLDLYNYWMFERKARYNDAVYQVLLQDSFKVLHFLFIHYKGLDFQGWIVEIQNGIRGFSLGYPLDKETFCIFYEIADLKIKGLSQFIFWFFCKELSSYKFINVMDDSGLENLRQVKLSYYPERLVSAYIVTQNG
ncbi:MAG: phosphatidylglycerol lysyltransferase domain-containing protein [Candidatus Omnitrophica bacterium]|nr:phosphatidylglycerol lysyltransferase domain-containing protein [Candidatus Omnitrophota bacterium]